MYFLIAFKSHINTILFVYLSHSDILPMSCYAPHRVICTIVHYINNRSMVSHAIPYKPEQLREVSNIHCTLYIVRLQRTCMYLFVLRFNIPVKNFAVLAQGHNMLPPVGIEPLDSQSNVCILTDKRNPTLTLGVKIRKTSPQWKSGLYHI